MLEIDSSKTSSVVIVFDWELVVNACFEQHSTAQIQVEQSVAEQKHASKAP